jgi:hypothetical protein
MVTSRPVDMNLPSAYFLQPSHHAQQGRLSASGRTNENGERPLLNNEVYAMDNFEVLKALSDGLEFYGRHQAT